MNQLFIQRFIYRKEKDREVEEKEKTALHRGVDRIQEQEKSQGRAAPLK